MGQGKSVSPPDHATLLTQHDRAALIVANDVECVLTDSEDGNRGRGVSRHGVLLSLAPVASFLSQAGQEHGRTIPVADIGQHLMLQQRSRSQPYQSTRLSRYDAVS